MTFVKEYFNLPFHFYKQLQELIVDEHFSETIKNVMIKKLKDGIIPLDPTDIITFFVCNSFSNTGKRPQLIRNVTLFSKEGEFYDNIPVSYSFDAKTEDDCEAYVSDGHIHVNIMEDMREFDV